MLARTEQEKSSNLAPGSLSYASSLEDTSQQLQQDPLIMSKKETENTLHW